MKIPLKSGIEQDALTRWRKYLTFRAGERKFAKRKYNRRIRQLGRMECKAYNDKTENKP